MLRKVDVRVVSAILALAGLCLVAGPAGADILLDADYPVQDEETQIRVVDPNGEPVSGASVEVTYRPGSEVSRIDDIGQSGADGTISWVPQQAGIATITATWTGPDQSEEATTTTVSVKFRAPPISGILIMVVAGLLLIVGSIVRVSNLLRSPQTS